MKERIIKITLVIVAVLNFEFSAYAGKAENNKKAKSTKCLTEITNQAETNDDSPIRPYSKNPWYWEYKGRPVMLLGASDDDNLFQWGRDSLVQQLDLIQTVGGNYVRNTMSDRDEGNIFAPKQLDDGRYDLQQWNEEYWNKLKFFLDETEKRDIYSFAEVSQNNQDALGPVGKKHWENLLFWRKMIAMSDEGPMPINNIKVYGQGVGFNTAAGTEKEAVERFWRNVFGGAASTRFHRPAYRGGDFYWGIGLSERARQTLRAVSMFLDEFDVFNAEPYEAFSTVGNSVDSYCMADIGKAYAVYFPGGRATVHLDPWIEIKKVSVKWLDVASLTWSDEQVLEAEWDNIDGSDWWGPQRVLTITTKDHRSYVAVVKVLE
jgi:hypothetical protein